MCSVLAVTEPQANIASPDSSSRFEVLGRWASGGMADVYVARQRGATGFDKVVALKVLREHLAHDPKFRAMFLAEVQTAALLDHPSIVQTFDAGILNERLYMAMEFVNGVTLGRFARAMHRDKGFPIPLAVSIAAQAAEALHYAHTLKDLSGVKLDLVHRDVSPSNLLISFQGRLKLLDFGIAKFSTKEQATRVGDLKGKLTYMSPEQATTGTVDRRSDVYSLGLVLWELLTGKRAIEGKSDIELVNSLMNRNLKAPSEQGANCDEVLDKIVMRALAEKADDRYESSEDFRRELSAYLAGFEPGFSPVTAMRDLMEEHFASRKGRVEKLLQEQAGVEFGPGSEHNTLPGFLMKTPSGSNEVTAENEYEKIEVVDHPGLNGSIKKTILALGGAVAVAVVAFLVMRGDGATSHQVMVSSVPAGAMVQMDGVSMGVAPLKLEIPSDRVTNVSVTHKGYTQWMRRLEPGANVDSLQAELVPLAAGGTLILRTSPPGAHVIFNGERQEGVTPTIVTGVDVDVSHSLIISAEGYEPVVHDFGFDGSRTHDVDLKLVPTQSAFLGASCSGHECQVVVDGEVVGTTPMARHSVSIGTAVKVELRRDNKVVVTKTLNLAAGELAEVTFEPTTEPAPVANPRRVRSRQTSATKRKQNKSPLTVAKTPKPKKPVVEPQPRQETKLDRNPYTR